jgi:hypothetical protein
VPSHLLYVRVLLSAAKGGTPILLLFTKSLSYPRLQLLCNRSNQGASIRMRKSSVESRGIHILRNRQSPRSLQTHFSGLSSMSIVFSSSRRVLPTNKASDRFLRKISFDPPMIKRYLPREVSIFHLLSYPRMSNGSGKPRKR